MTPINNQTPNRSQFVHPSPNIIALQTSIPRIGTKGTKGVLKLRFKSGRFMRNIQTPAQTNINANRVPMLVMSPTISPGTKAANNPMKIKNIQLDL